ncbi:hypothetical protein KAT36_01310 [Candidatus Pacearchaeota archaeon]|nr:hypothetical protein [Candidatus Pacearchaeota archaeon]
MEQIEKFTIEFFENLKCNIFKDGDVLVVESVPKNFEDLYGKVAPYRLSFSGQSSGAEFVGRGSVLLAAMTKFLKGVGKTTLLKIDFDVNPIKEIKKVISFKNCEIDNIVKKHKNNFFSRFTFMTTFQYLNESEQVVNEIYIHDGKIVEGDLSGYSVVEGKGAEVSSKHMEKSYDVAREALRGMLEGRTTEIGEALGAKMEGEIGRIRGHYGNLMSELGGDLSGAIEKMREVELVLRMADGEEKKVLGARLDRLRKGLVKIGDDDSRNKILKEQEFTIKDVMHKYSLNIDNKLVNMTVIYYPVFSFNLHLKSEVGGRRSVVGGGAGRLVKMSYDPLTKTLNKLVCESCGREIVNLNLCSAGHINCERCLVRCGECGEIFCKKCLKRSCSACGKLLCKDCSIMCFGCGKYVCKDHMRKDCVSGEERCVNCLRACLRCHGSASAKYFGEALDGSKVCQKCLGAEKRGAVLDRVFGE